MESIYWILILSVLGPIIGSAIGVIRKPSKIVMYNLLAFAAGVMLAISFLELLPASLEGGNVTIAAFGFISGAMLMYIMDKLVPHIHPELCTQEQGENLKKTAYYLLFGIFLHNIPEGMAIATGTITDMTSALMIALAIAIHNIPEGICTSAPYYATNNRRLKSFLVSSSTAIPLLVGFFAAKFLFGIVSGGLISFIIALTAGLMVYISADELIPASCSKSNGVWNHSAIFSLVAGVLFVLIIGN